MFLIYDINWPTPKLGFEMRSCLRQYFNGRPLQCDAVTLEDQVGGREHLLFKIIFFEILQFDTHIR